MFRLPGMALLIALTAGVGPATAQAPAPAAPPTRDPQTPGYVTAKDLPDGANAPAKQDGNFILGPTHSPAPETTAHEGVPRGDVFTFTICIRAQRRARRPRRQATNLARGAGICVEGVSNRGAGELI